MMLPVKFSLRKSFVFTLSLFLACLVNLVPVHAVPLKWEITGPGGGEIDCLASPDSTGTIVYAGCRGGVFKSTDAGEHWQVLSGSPPNVTLLAVPVNNPNVVYAGWNNGVSRSTDGGRTWQLCYNSVYGTSSSGRQPTGLAVGSDAKVYATFDNTLNDHGPFCVSSDGGNTWIATNPPGYNPGYPPINFVSIYRVAADPFQAGIIYINAGWYWRSQNYGQSFERIAQPPHGGGRIYAEPDAQGVLYSLGSMLDRSNDLGSSWFTTYGPDSHDVISHQGIGWAVLVACSDGVFRNYPYSFETAPWTDFSQGLGDAKSTVSCLLLHTPVGAFAGTTLGVYRTDVINPTAAWQPKNQGLTNTTITCLAADPLHTLYAGTDGKGIFKSTDGGATWQAANNGIDQTGYLGYTVTVNALSVDPHNYFLVYAATNKGLYRSTDRGATWLPTRFTSANSVLADPDLPGTVFAIAEENYTGGTWFSNDGGASWSPLGIAGYNWNALARGANDFPLYALSYNVIYKLANAVLPWQPLTTLPTGVSAVSMAVDPRNPAVLYVGSYDKGMYKSVDGGASWFPLSAPPFNFTPNRAVTAITVDPVNSDVYVGLQNGSYSMDYSDPEQLSTMNSGGLWKSSNGGNSWTNLQSPNYRGVNAILLEKELAASTIYCGLTNSGVAIGKAQPLTPASLNLLLLND